MLGNTTYFSDNQEFEANYQCFVKNLRPLSIIFGIFTLKPHFFDGDIAVIP